MGASAKSLGLGACTALVVGNMVGSGVFALPASLAFLYAIGAIYGAGAEVVFYGYLLLLAGVPVFVWVRWRALVPADAITDGAGGAR